MGKKRLRSLLLTFLVCCVIMTGCSNLLEEDNESINDIANEQLALDNATNPNEPDDQVMENEAACNSGEQYIAEEEVCALPLTCSDVQQCELWSEQQVEQLQTLYGSFVEVKEIELTEEEEALSEEDEDIIVTYRIQNNDLVLNGEDPDESYYEDLWEDFAWIFPERYRWMVSSFASFSHVDTLAYVVQEDDDWESWSLGINVEPSSSINEAIGTLTHEFGHLLFLNSNESDPYGDPNSCSTVYMEDTGCVYEDSYIYAFKQLFWEDDEAEYREDKFVSEYASNHIDEDMAESWMHFVLTNKPQGATIAEQKVLFFYEYEELIYLKAEILSRISTLLERAA